MAKKTFSDLDERDAAVVAAASVAMHALISSRAYAEPTNYTISKAFDLGESFIAECEARYGK